MDVIDQMRQEKAIRELISALAALIACGNHNQFPSGSELEAGRNAIKNAIQAIGSHG